MRLEPEQRSMSASGLTQHSHGHLTYPSTYFLAGGRTERLELEEPFRSIAALPSPQHHSSVHSERL